MSTAIKQVIPASIVAGKPGADQLEGWSFESLATDPATPADLAIWFNTTEGRLKWKDGASIRSVAFLADIPGGNLTTYIDLAPNATFTLGRFHRIATANSYTLPAGRTGSWVDTVVASGTGVATLEPAIGERINGLTTGYTLKPKAQALLVYDPTAQNWEVFGVSATSNYDGLEYSNWGTLAASASQLRPDNNTFANYITARVGNSVGMPIEEKVTANDVNMTIGVATIAPMTNTITGQKPVVVRTPSGNTTYNTTDIIPPGFYIFSYNKIELILDLQESDNPSAPGTNTFLSLADTPTTYAGQAGKSYRVNTTETGLEPYTPATSSPMTGASNTVAGTSGTVPAPVAGDQSKYLKGDGTWAATPTSSPMTGASSTVAGTSGTVPAPVAGDQTKYLKGDGTWDIAPLPPLASETVEGTVEKATLAEVQGGTDAVRYIAPIDAEVTYLKKSLVDAKGDLLVATGDNTVTRLPAGLPGQMLCSDYTATAGLKWIAPVNISRISTTQTSLQPGEYDLDSSGAAFNITLADTIGSWFFYNTNRSLSVNGVTLTQAGYTDASGSLVSSTYLLNKPKQYVFLHTELGNNYRVSTTDTVQSPPLFTPGGAWSAATNTPNLNTPTNRINGSTYYVYYISTTGTVDLGAGATAFEAGGRIEWYSATVYNYLPPAQAVPGASETVAGRVEIADANEAAAGISDTVALTPKKVDSNYSRKVVEYVSATARTAQTGYAITQADIDNNRLFVQTDDGTIWTPNGTIGSIVWQQLGGSQNSIPLYDANLVYGSTVANGARYAISATNGWIYRAIVATVTDRSIDPSANGVEWELVHDCHATAFNSSSLAYDIASQKLKGETLMFFHSIDGTPQNLKVRPNLTFGKTATIDGVAATATAGVVTISGVTKVLAYQDFTNPNSTSGTTKFITFGSGDVKVVEYSSSTARLAQTGYAITQADIDNNRLFVQTDDGTIWTPNGTIGSIVWQQLGGSQNAIASPLWVSGDRISHGMMRSLTTTDGTVMELLRSGAGRTTGAAWATSEAAQWTCVGQSLVRGYLPLEVLPIGYRIKENGVVYQHIVAGQGGAAFDAAEQLKWQAEIDVPASQHDSGLTTPLAISPVRGVQAHLEGGAGYAINAANIPDNWQSAIINTTNSPQPVTFTGFAGAFVCNGADRTPITSPYQVQKNTVYRFYSVINGNDRWLNIEPTGTAANSVLSSAINFQRSVSLICDTSWVSRSIGAIGSSADFAAPDASNHYQAKRNMIIDVSVTGMTSDGGSITVGCAVQLFRNNTWVNAFGATTATTSGAQVVPFHQSAQVAIVAGEYIRFQTYVSYAPGTREFRISITEAPSAILAPTNRSALEPYTISGVGSGVGYDGVPVPIQITVPTGHKLLSVSATNGAIITGINAIANTCNVQVDKAATVLSMTSAPRDTFRSLQLVGTNETTIAVSDNATVTTTIDYTRGDYLFLQVLESNSQTAGGGDRYSTFTIRLRGSDGEKHGIWLYDTWFLEFRIINRAAGTVQFYDANISLTVVKMELFASAENSLVIPTGTTTRSAVDVTINGVNMGIAFTGTSQRISAPALTNRVYLTAVANNGCTAKLADPLTGAIELAVPNGTTGVVNIVTTDTPIVANEYYLGRWSNQAGNSGDTNGGHTMTQQRMVGSGITTSNQSVFTLTGGIYRVVVSVRYLQQANCWRATDLFVDGVSVDTIMSGHDGGNWEGGSGPIVWIIDATTASKTIQVKRTSSGGSNGNSHGTLEIQKTSFAVVPAGTEQRTLVTLTANSGAVNVNDAANTLLMSGTSARVRVAVPAGQMIQSIAPPPAGVTATIADERAGTLEVSIAPGTTGARDLTLTFAPIVGRSAYQVVNAGVWAALGSVAFTIPTAAIPTGGNRSLQVRSNTGGTINLRWFTWLTWDGTITPSSATVTPTSTQYLSSTWNFGNAGNTQQAIIEDQTNNRRYKVQAVIGSGYSNNLIWCEEVS